MFSTSMPAPYIIDDNSNISLKFGEFFSGSIDEVHIYNRALSDSEIQTLYNATK